MITHVVGARHPNIVAGWGRGGEGEGGVADQTDDAEESGVAGQDEDTDARAVAYEGEGEVEDEGKIEDAHDVACEVEDADD